MGFMVSVTGTTKEEWRNFIGRLTTFHEGGKQTIGKLFLYPTTSFPYWNHQQSVSHPIILSWFPSKLLLVPNGFGLVFLWIITHATKKSKAKSLAAIAYDKKSISTSCHKAQPQKIVYKTSSRSMKLENVLVCRDRFILWLAPLRFQDPKSMLYCGVNWHFAREDRIFIPFDNDEEFPDPEWSFNGWSTVVVKARLLDYTSPHKKHIHIK